MANSDYRKAWNSPLATGIKVLLLLSLAACAKDIPPQKADSTIPLESSTVSPAQVDKVEPASTAASFVTEPDIELDPHLNAPLAAHLSYETNVGTRFDLEVVTRDYSHKVSGSKLKKKHVIPVLGLRPDREYEIKLNVYTKDSSKSVLNKTLSVATEALPEGFPNLKVAKRIDGKIEPGFTLFDIIPEGGNSEFGAVLAIVDTFGEIVWYQVGTRYSDVRQLENGNLLFIEGNKIVDMNLMGERIRELTAIFKPEKGPRKPGEVHTPIFHHEVYPLPRGNFLTLSVEYRRYENYPTNVKDPDAPKEKANVVGDVAIEIRPDGSIRKKWPLLDYMDPRRIGWGSLGPYWDPFFNKKTRDWSHGNAVIYSPEDNAILVTSRHQDATIKFRRKNGQLMWILAPHENWDKKKYGKFLLKPVNDQKYFFPFHSHAPEIMPNGNLLIYDNGNFRATPPDITLPPEHNFSRAVEYRIDEKKREIELVWEYGQHVDQPIFSGALGDADYLPEKNNVLITHGNIPGKEGKLSAAILEVTHTTPAEEVFRLDVFDTSDNSENGWRIYRSERIPDLYGTDAGISISDLKKTSIKPN